MESQAASRFRDFFIGYAEEMAKGSITGEDLREILEKEYDIKVKVE